jgi:hypothetical protein
VKAWQILVVGCLVLVATLFFSSYERVIAAAAAILILAAAGFGFLMRPQRGVYYVRVSHYDFDPDEESIIVAHDFLAVRVEIGRLWILFVPTFAAASFLTYSAAMGATWNFSVLDALFTIGSLGLVMARLSIMLVLGALSAWIAERSILRDADACSVISVTSYGPRITYAFVDGGGEYYGGEGMPFAHVPPELAGVVFYHRVKPHLNRMTPGFVFHKFTIIGHGLPDLDTATVEVRMASDRVG